MPRKRRKQKGSPRPGVKVYHVETEVTKHEPLPRGYSWKWRTFTHARDAQKELKRLRASGEAGTYAEVKEGKYIVIRRKGAPRLQNLRKRWNEGISSKEQQKEYRILLRSQARDNKHKYCKCAQCGLVINLPRGVQMYLSPTGERYHWKCRPEGAMRD
jgi:hypothetical protein